MDEPEEEDTQRRPKLDSYGTRTGDSQELEAVIHNAVDEVVNKKVASISDRADRGDERASRGEARADRGDVRASRGEAASDLSLRAMREANIRAMQALQQCADLESRMAALASLENRVAELEAKVANLTSRR